jgi:general secretion pathway protein H
VLITSQAAKAKIVTLPIGNKRLSVYLLIQQNPLRNSSAGFTLVEIMIVLLLLALMMGLISPTILSGIQRSSIRQVTTDLVMAIRRTRAQALTRNQEHYILFNLAENTYSVPPHKKTTKVPDSLTMELITANIEQQDSTSGAIRFYGDGSSTGGTITIIHEHKKWIIDIPWLTGQVNLQRINKDNTQ